MADPYNYTIASPMEAFQKSYAFGQAMSQQEAERAKQEAAQQRAQQVQGALQSIATDRSPENIARNLLLFPELKDQITASESVLGEAERRSANTLRAEVISLARAGNTTAARERLATQAQAYANTPGKEREAQAAQALLQAFDKNPEAVILPMTIQLAQSDDKLYGTLFGAGEKPTTFQQDFDFIKKTFGDAAAAEFAQFGRSGIVSIPLGDGRTYVGPPSMAPGASRWRQQPGAETPPPAEQPKTVTEQGAASILGNASRTNKITQAEANVIRQSLGPEGQGRFNKWLTDNKIKIIVRTGTMPDGRRVVQYQDGTIEYGAD